MSTRHGWVAFFALVIFLNIVSVLPEKASAHESADPDITVVHISDEGFIPEKVTIPVGQSVRFENIGSEEHWPASNIHPTHRAYPDSDIKKCGTEEKKDIFDACGGLKEGETYLFTFTIPGIWKYHDHEFPQYGGEIVVTGEASSTAQKEKNAPYSFSRLWTTLKVWYMKMVYTLMPGKLARDLSATSLIDISEDEKPELSYWLSILGPQKVMDQLLAESYKDGTYVRNCHAAAHNVGRESYALYGNDIFQLCSAECHSGCYHGGTEAYFSEHGTAALEKDLNVICSLDLNAFFSHQCLHGIGHGLMAWSNYKLFDALEACNLLSKGMKSCVSGIFMENIVGGLSEDQGHFTDYLNDDPHYPCSIVPKDLIDDCYFLQTSRMLQLFGSDWKRIATECHKAPEVGRQNCFTSMGRDVGGRIKGNPQQSVEACDNSPLREERRWCIDGSVRDTFCDSSTSQEGIDFCAFLREEEEERKCYNTIFQRARQVFSSKKDADAFCAKVEPAYREPCSNSVAAFFKK